MIASADLQTALYGALSGNITGTVHDEVPATTAAPYTVIGEMTAAPDDLHDADGGQETATLHFWDTAKGSLRVKAMMQEAYAILHGKPLMLAGGRVVWMSVEFETVVKENVDGVLWRHGVQRVRAYI